MLNALKVAAAATLVSTSAAASAGRKDAARMVEGAWAAWAHYRAVVEASAESTGVADAEAASVALGRGFY